MYTNDTRYGSNSDRYHIFGIPPYNVYGRVPGLSHYLNDRVPYFLCCEWTDMCDSFLFVRETAECKGYRFSKSGKKSNLKNNFFASLCIYIFSNIEKLSFLQLFYSDH